MSIVVGNPRSGSRTRMVAEVLGAACASAVGDVSTTVIDLADFGGRLFDPADSEVVALTESVAASDLLIAASPTFKATYSGLLKCFFDRYPGPGLAGAVAVPVMMGGNPAHSLAPEVALRPLLVELGASCPTRSLYVTDPDLDRLDEVIAGWVGSAGPILARALGD